METCMASLSTCMYAAKKFNTYSDRIARLILRIRYRADDIECIFKIYEVEVVSSRGCINSIRYF